MSQSGMPLESSTKCFSDYSMDHPGRYPLIAPLPNDLQFGLSNNCNFHCVFCGDHRPGHAIKKRRFSTEMDNMMRRLLPHLKQAAFHENSEFFIDSNFSDILQICRENRVTVSLNTNASYLTENQIHAIENHSGHINIAVSLDAATRKTYWKLRGYDFDKVLANASVLVSIVSRNAAYKKRVWCDTHTTAAFIIMKENKTEALDFLHMADEMGFDRVSYYRLHEGSDWSCTRGDFNFEYSEQGPWHFKDEYNRILGKLKKESIRLGILSWLPEPYPSYTFTLPDRLYTEHKPRDYPEPGNEPVCAKPWTGRSVILASGALYPCCHAWGPDAELGNLRDGSFDRAWNSPKTRNLRNALLHHHFPKMCRNGSCPTYRTWLLQKHQ
jgi:radical SAM protein with 4Fe4S-binding SPASM domain